MEDEQSREVFDTGLRKIRTEIKTRLAPHGLFGTVKDFDTTDGAQALQGSRIEIVVKGRTAVRSFDRQQIEGCHLRVTGAVLSEIISMVEELAA